MIFSIFFGLFEIELFCRYQNDGGYKNVDKKNHGWGNLCNIFSDSWNFYLKKKLFDPKFWACPKWKYKKLSDKQLWKIKTVEIKFFNLKYFF